MYVYYPGVVLITLFLSGAIAAATATNFCEQCREYTKERVLGYYALDDLRALLFALCTGAPPEQGQIHMTGGRNRQVGAQENWIKVVKFSCSCKGVVLLEIYANVGTSTALARKTPGAKLLFSGRVDTRLCRAITGK